MICGDCPRHCRAERGPLSGKGVCGMGTVPVLARAALHHGEEPCISGTRGSGAVFFSGCALHCAYCQNAAISAGNFGSPVPIGRLREIYGELAGQGAHNINLVNPTHFARAVALSLTTQPIPVVYNCGGYESLSALRMLEGKVQVYLPDLKYLRAETAARYSHAPDYPGVAAAALLEMFRQLGPYRLDSEGILQSGLLIRHLVLPGQLENTLDIIDWVTEHFAPGDILFSLMGQYIPCGDAAQYPEINRRITPEEYARAEDYLFCCGFEDGYVQDLSAADGHYVPDFNLQGV